MNYKALTWGCIALTVACWAVVTGLSIEKVLIDGVQSWTLLLAMPVFVAAVAFLLHQSVEDFRELRVIRGAVGLMLGLLTFGVTLPNSVGSAGGAKDAAVAQAQASNRGLALAEGALVKAENDLKDANAGVLKECEGAPAIIPEGTWPKCQWWRRQVAAHTLAVAEHSKSVVSAPVEKTALSGDTRIAWALSAVGSRLPEAYRFTVTDADVQMAQPMFPPVVGELLCAFFGFMGLEFRKKWKAAESGNETANADNSRKINDGSACQSSATHATQLADVSDTELQRLRRYFETKAAEASEPDPTKPKKKSKRQSRKDRVVAKIRAQTLAGHRPSFRLVQSRYRLPERTAYRYLQQAMS